MLAGGRSRRMGVDKPLMVVEGEPMVARVAAALTAAGAGEVFVVGGRAAAIEVLGLRLVPDRWPGAGPLGGVVTALEAAAGDPVVVLAADLLRPDPSAIRSTVLALDAGDLAVPVVDGRAQWLHAAWRRRCREELGRRFAQGERAIHRAVAAAGLVAVEIGGLRDDVAADADTPDQLPPR